MVSKRIRQIFFLLSVISIAAQAQDKEIVAIHGFDRMSCEDWLGSKEDEASRSLYIAWIRGIVTGYNFANPENQVAMGRMPGDFTVGLFVDSYCRAHRDKSFAGAAFELIEQKRGSSGMVEIAPVPTSDDNDGFNAWLKKQSDDMRSLDPNVLRNIYNKETAIKAAK